MSLLNKLLTKFFGNKSDRDIKEIQPFIDKIKEVEARLINASSDDLRALTIELRKRIQDTIAPLEKEIEQLKLKILELETSNGNK